MTKAQLVDLVFLNLSGGKPSPDNTVQRAEIRVALPMAVNEAIALYNKRESKDKLSQIRLLGYSDAAADLVNQEFLTTYKVSVIKDASRDRYYFETPVDVQSLPGTKGLSEVFSAKGEHTYVKIGSEAVIASLPRNIEQVFYWYERQTNGSGRIYFNQIGLPVCDHYARIVASVADIGDDDQLPLPDGLEFTVARELFKFFAPQAEIPADFIADDKEVRQ